MINDWCSLLTGRYGVAIRERFPALVCQLRLLDLWVPNPTWNTGQQRASKAEVSINGLAISALMFAPFATVVWLVQDSMR
jgi:hypothetical protein